MLWGARDLWRLADDYTKCQLGITSVVHAYGSLKVIQDDHWLPNVEKLTNIQRRLHPDGSIGSTASTLESCPPGPRSRPKISLSPATSKALTQPPKTC